MKSPSGLFNERRDQSGAPSTRKAGPPSKIVVGGTKIADLTNL